jgi:hypothetical protein
VYMKPEQRLLIRFVFISSCVPFLLNITVRVIYLGEATRVLLLYRDVVVFAASQNYYPFRFIGCKGHRIASLVALGYSHL